MQEEWKDVVGFEDYFKISNYGNVFSKRTQRLLKPHKSKSGYVTVATKIGGRGGEAYCFKLHRLVAEAFLEKPSQELLEAALLTKYNKVVVNHKDLNKDNNFVDNLEWCTYKENINHAIDNGAVNYTVGFLNNTSKFDRITVDYIRSVYIPRHREYGQRALSRKFGVSHSTIADIVSDIRYLN